MNYKKGIAPIIVLLIALGVLVVGGILYYETRKPSSIPPVTNTQIPITSSISAQSANNQPTSAPTINTQSATATTNVSSTQVTSNSSASSSQIVISDQYGLFAQQSGEKSAGFIPVTRYKDDGIINSGPYAGYHRIIGWRTFDEPFGDEGVNYFFATNDYKSYILDINIDSSTLTDLNASDSIFNKAKVIATGSVPLDHPNTINEGNFVLTRDNIDWSPISSSSISLASNVSGLRFFAEAPLPLAQIVSGYASDTAYTNSVAAQNQYLSANDEVLVQDQYGLVFSYLLIPIESFNPLDPSLMSGVASYNAYAELMPFGCMGIIDKSSYVLKNITSADLVKLSTTPKGLDVYTLKDKNHLLNQAEFYDKITLMNEPGYWDTRLSVPTFQDYVAKNPVLILRDPWERWIGLGEAQYQLEAGCGKPVIYLYPTKPTEVTLKFVNPIDFNVDIPTYSDGWNILAYPDGKLKDLQPQFTDCSKVNYNLFGSAYARSACAHGIYPYLYWSGRTVGTYPVADSGWIISRSNLGLFFNEKLTEMGLNEKEKDDMTSYWVPELLRKNVQYYRISFFQTAEMNQLIPMHITPKPDTVFRVFLDWSPLDSIPNTLLLPEILNHLDRKGFTVVEWGGLKQ